MYVSRAQHETCVCEVSVIVIEKGHTESPDRDRRVHGGCARWRNRMVRRGSRLSHSFALPLPRYAGEGNTKVRRSISTRGEIARESNREIGAGSLPRENGDPVVLEIIQGTVASVLSSA